MALFEFFCCMPLSYNGMQLSYSSKLHVQLVTWHLHISCVRVLICQQLTNIDLSYIFTELEKKMKNELGLMHIVGKPKKIIFKI